MQSQNINMQARKKKMRKNILQIPKTHKTQYNCSEVHQATRGTRAEGSDQYHFVNFLSVIQTLVNQLK